MLKAHLQCNYGIKVYHPVEEYDESQKHKSYYKNKKIQIEKKMNEYDPNFFQTINKDTFLDFLDRMCEEGKLEQHRESCASDPSLVYPQDKGQEVAGKS